MGWEAIRLKKWYATPQGETVARLTGLALGAWLKEAAPVRDALCFGYTQPQMAHITPHAQHIFGAAPAEMGVSPWPGGGKNRFAQVRIDALPYPDAVFDRVIMMHLLEGATSPRAALRETWRVLKPGGRLLVMTPNRGGLWARRDNTPLGWGRPFSPRQLSEHLRESLFLPRQVRFALFMPPFSAQWLLAASGAWEKAGMRWFAPLGGVILCDAEKTVYATIPILQGKRQQPVSLPFPLIEHRGDKPPLHETHTNPTHGGRTQ